MLIKFRTFRTNICQKGYGFLLSKSYNLCLKKDFLVIAKGDMR